MALSAWDRLEVIGRLRDALAGLAPMKLAHHDGEMTTELLDRLNCAGALPFLTARQRVGVVLWLRDRLTIEQIAGRLEIAEATVKADRRKAIEAVAERLDAEIAT